MPYLLQIVLGLSAPVIAGFSVYIGYQQWKLSTYKLKHDLFEKRWKVYAATNDVKISFNAPAVGDAVIMVLDENGKKVLQQTAKINIGNNSINIDNFHTLNEGNYTIQLINNNKTHSSKFLIWN